MRVRLASSVLIMSGLLAAPGVTMAQSPGGVVVEYESDYGGAESAPRSAKEQAVDFIATKNWRSKPEIIWAIGTAAINAQPDDKGFGQSRREAAALALLQAKRVIAEKLAVQISTAMSFRFTLLDDAGSGGSDADTAAVPTDLGILDKATLLLESDLDRQLRDRGINPDDPDGAREKAAAAKKVASSSRFQSAISVMARQELGGVQAYRTFESIAPGDGVREIAVLAVVSPRSRQLQRAMLGLEEPPRRDPGTSIGDWARELGPETLLYTHGCQPRTDESGELVLVLFGQAEALDEKVGELVQSAKRSAGRQGQAEARRFLGEMVVCQGQESQGSNWEYYADKSEQYMPSNAIDELLQAEAKVLDIPGIAAVYEWEAVHPVSGRKVYGWVGTLSYSSALDANALRDKFDATRGSEGGEGISRVRPKPEQPATKKPIGSGRGGSGVGAEGEDP